MDKTIDFCDITILFLSLCYVRKCFSKYEYFETADKNKNIEPQPGFPEKKCGECILPS